MVWRDIVKHSGDQTVIKVARRSILAEQHGYFFCAFLALAAVGSSKDVKMCKNALVFLFGKNS
jgi:hypothetical protein